MPSFSVIGFNARKRGWRALHINFYKQTWLVTGASGGIGAAIAEIAALHGARVIVVARSAEKLKALKDRVNQKIANRRGPRRNAPVGTIIPAICDLSDMNAISKLVDQLSRKVTIDVLINNVGVLNEKHKKSPQGFEKSYATNLLGQYYLTESLLRKEVFNRTPLIISMSSGGLYNQPLNLKLLDQAEEEFDGLMAYASQKRAQIALTDYWRRTYSNHQVFAYAMHPGWVKTSGVQASLPFFNNLLKRALRTPAQGADTALWIAQNRPGTPNDVVWFDRKPRSPYIFSDTRKPRIFTEDLIISLDNDIKTALKS